VGAKIIKNIHETIIKGDMGEILIQIKIVGVLHATPQQ
jgi:hypothetical protein